MTITTPAVPLADCTPSQRQAIIRNVLDESIVNPISQARAAELAGELAESIGPSTSPDELHRTLAVIDQLRRANTPKKESPFFAS